MNSSQQNYFDSILPLINGWIDKSRDLDPDVLDASCKEFMNSIKDRDSWLRWYVNECNWGSSPGTVFLKGGGLKLVANPADLAYVIASCFMDYEFKDNKDLVDFVNRHHDGLCITLESREMYDRAIIGVTLSPRYETPRVVYSRDLIIRALCHGKDGMEQDEAYEWFDFNTAGAYIDGGPLFAYHPGTSEETEFVAGDVYPEGFETLKEMLEQFEDDGALPFFGDGEKFHDAIIGLSEGICSIDAHLLYSAKKCLEIILTGQKCSDEEANTILHEMVSSCVNQNDPVLILTN